MTNSRQALMVAVSERAAELLLSFYPPYGALEAARPERCRNSGQLPRLLPPSQACTLGSITPAGVGTGAVAYAGSGLHGSRMLPAQQFRETLGLALWKPSGRMPTKVTAVRERH